MALTILDLPGLTSKNARRWVAGLTWEAFNSADASRAVKRQALQTARAFHQEVTGEQATHYVYSENKGATRLVGCGTSGEDAKDLYPAALVLLRALPERSWVAACRLPDDQVWLVEVVDARILPGSDIVCDKDTADLRIIEMENDVPGIAVHRFDSDVVPGGALSQLKHIPRLRSFAESQKTRVMALAGAGLAALLVISVAVWWVVQPSQPVELTDEERAALIASHRKPVELPPIELPWVKSPSFNAALEQCVTQYAATNGLQSGWQLNDWLCTDNRAVSVWARMPYGRFSEPPEGAGFDPRTPNRAEQVESLPSLDPQGWQPLLEAKSASAFIMDIARLHDAAVDIRWGEEASRMVPSVNGDGQVSQRLGYADNQVTVKMQTLPGVEFFSALSEIPSLTFTQLRYTGSGWELVMALFSTPLEQ